MKLYRVMFDGEYDYIEAKSFFEAINVWRTVFLLNNNPGDFDINVEPEEVRTIFLPINKKQ